VPIVVVKGCLSEEVYSDMIAYLWKRDGTVDTDRLDQFILECAVRGFEEVKKDVQVQR